MAYYSKIAQDAPVYASYSCGANAGLADTAFFESDGHYKIDRVVVSHGTNGTAVGTVVLTVRKSASGTSVAGGDAVLSGNHNLKASANVPEVMGLSLTEANLRVSPGARVGVDFVGTLTDVAGVSVGVRMKRVRPLP